MKLATGVEIGLQETPDETRVLFMVPPGTASLSCEDATALIYALKKQVKLALYADAQRFTELPTQTKYVCPETGGVVSLDFAPTGPGPFNLHCPHCVQGHTIEWLRLFTYRKVRGEWVGFVEKRDES